MRRAALVACVLVLAAGALAAGPDGFAPTCKRAAGAAARGDWAGAVSTLEEALDVARTAAPLVVRQAVITVDKHRGLGLYEPVPGGVAPRSMKRAADGALVEERSMNLYVEVANFAYAPAGDGKQRATLVVSGAFSYDDVDGKVDVGEKELGTQTFETRVADHVTSFGLDLVLGDKAPAGTWHLTLKVRDTVSGKTAQRTLDFVLR